MLLDDAIVEVPLHNGLRHYWSFNDDSGAGDWTDIVHALGPVPVMFTGGGSPSIIAGLEGNAVRMESSSSEYLRESNDLLAKGINPLGSGDFTFAGFWRLNSLASKQDLLWRLDTTLGEREFMMQYDDTSQAIRIFGSSDGVTADFDFFHSATANNIPQGEWLFLVARRSGANMELLVNQSGIESVAVGEDFSFHESSRNFLIGAAEDAGSVVRFGDVDIDRLGFWDRALTDSELNQLYNNGAGLPYPFKTLDELDPLASGIVTCYRMGWNAGQRGFDVIAESRNDLTANNSPPPVVGAVGSGTEFNGTNEWFELADASAQDWEIGNRDWTAHCRFKCTNASTNPMLIAKNNEGGIPGGTEWNIQLVGNDVWDYAGFRAGHASIAQTHSVFGSGVDFTDTTWDDGEYHSIVWGFDVASGMFIQVDDGERAYNSDLVGIGTNVGNADFTLARRDFSTPLWFAGVIDVVHLWHRLLTVDEARRLNGV